ncbi:MAG: GGDEF domain-containing protein [Sulfuricurvum sp.]|nr:GGDEF domain-containing protein [Sulfuricurvum sp.]
MKYLNQKHAAITREIKQIIAGMKVVFPAQYGKLYWEAAKTYHIELKPDELLTREMLDEKMVRHIITLSECTDRAISAMEAKNKSELEAVLAETKELKEEIAELQKIVYEDSLTKTYNRRWFNDTFLENDQLTLNQTGTLVLVDLNKFKSINDAYGHITGDKVLVHIAEKLRETRMQIIRYGGDEFIIIFNADKTVPEIKNIMEGMIRYFDTAYFKVEEGSFRLSFSYGITPFSHGDDISTIIESADSAMYAHKNGVNQQ